MTAGAERVLPSCGLADTRAPLLVLGLGNLLFTDEGVGVVAAAQLAQLGLAGVDVLDGGTLGLALLPAIEGRRALLVLDSVASSSSEPGAVRVLTGAELRGAWRRCVSAHQLGITDALAVAGLAGRAPETVTAVAMVPASLDTGCGLSDTARARLPEMVATARAVLREWGVPDA